MQKGFSIIMMCLSIMIILTGCWSKRELNEIGIATAMGIDKTEDGFLVSVQIVNPSEIAGKSGSGRTEVVRFMKTGKTVSEAFRKIMTDAPRKLYLAHIRVIVFGEEMAKEGIGKALDALSREEEMRSDFYITVAKESTAADILNVQTAFEKIPTNKLFNAIEASEKNWAATIGLTLDELISSVVSKGKEPVLTGIYVYGDPEYGGNVENVHNVSPATGLRINDIAVFKTDKLLGWLNMDESKGFNYLTDKVKETVVDIPCEDGKLSIETHSSKTSVKGKMEKGKPVINITVHTEGDVGEVECNIDLSKQESIKEIKKKYQNEIKDNIEKVIRRVQDKYKSDIFGFGEAILRAEPKAWKRLEPNWSQEFSNVKVNIQVKANIRRLGSISKSFQKEIEE